MEQDQTARQAEIARLVAEQEADADGWLDELSASGPEYACGLWGQIDLGNFDSEETHTHGGNRIRVRQEMVVTRFTL